MDYDARIAANFQATFKELVTKFATNLVPLVMSNCLRTWKTLPKIGTISLITTFGTRRYNFPQMQDELK